MKKIKFYQFICLLLVIVVISSCRKNDNNHNNNFKVNFQNPQALLIKAKSNAKSGDTNTLFQIDGNGNVIPIIQFDTDGNEFEFTIYQVYTFSEGVIIYTNIGAYILYLDNTYWKISDNQFANFIGENENDDLIFEDVSIIRKGSQAITKLQTSLTSPRVSYLSGNFAIVWGVNDNIWQIFNTVDNKRYNITWSKIVALNKEKVLIDSKILDMTTGIYYDCYSPGDENIYLKNGAVIMRASGYQDALGIIDPLGHWEVICNDKFNYGSYCGYPTEKQNCFLFNTGDYFVVKELNKISVVKRGNLSKTEILSGYNITKIAVKSNKVYFIAEDNYGVKMVGVFSLDDNTVTLFETEDEYEGIFTI